MRWGTYLLAGACALAAGPRAATAQPTAYDLTPRAGEWLIFVTSFKGDAARHLAFELASEIRRDYKLWAYVYNRGAEEREKERRRVEAIRQQQTAFLQQSGLPADTRLRVRSVRIDEEYAVVVGGYKEGGYNDMDEARAALAKIKKLKPPSEKFLAKTFEGASTEQSIRRGKEQAVNPFETFSFVVHNPVLPTPKDPDAGKPDEAIKSLNAGEPYSLLKCRRPWTLVVKSFRGATVTGSDEKGAEFNVFGTKTSADFLSAAGKQAHSLADLLRTVGFKETYVLHTRYESIVTVGGYHSADDPELKAMQRKLGSFRLQPAGGQVAGSMFELLREPMPMQVPQF